MNLAIIHDQQILATREGTGISPLSSSRNAKRDGYVGQLSHSDVPNIFLAVAGILLSDEERVPADPSRAQNVFPEAVPDMQPHAIGLPRSRALEGFAENVRVGFL